MERIPQELKDFLIKIIIPSLVAISIKLSVQSKKEKISWFNAVTSVVTGVGCAYLTSNWVMHTFSEGNIPIVIACITVVGEKIAYWLIFKFNFDLIGDAFINYWIDKYKNKGQ